eukprot:TRINITY_DN56315_c0_g1_i1.p1 TRINITY_DN56315_c0_g1~~TRINITY_DN56315_c0_g1_i1.p1  ORF type:complete len:438 (-),score=105.61 TRINITY_DN56315_c0_g1_i1:44-1357(-)
MSDKHPAKIAKYLLQGWCLLNEYCPNGQNIPLVKSKEGKLVCAGCTSSCPYYATHSEAGAAAPAPPAVPPLSPAPTPALACGGAAAAAAAGAGAGAGLILSPRPGGVQSPRPGEREALAALAGTGRAGGGLQGHGLALGLAAASPAQDPFSPPLRHQLGTAASPSAGDAYAAAAPVSLAAPPPGAAGARTLGVAADMCANGTEACAAGAGSAALVLAMPVLRLGCLRLAAPAGPSQRSRLRGDTLIVKVKAALGAEAAGSSESIVAELAEILQSIRGRLVDKVLLPLLSAGSAGAARAAGSGGSLSGVGTGQLQIDMEDGARFSLPEADCLVLPVQRVALDSIAAQILEGILASHWRGSPQGLAGVGAHWLEVCVASGAEEGAEVALRRPTVAAASAAARLPCAASGGACGSSYVGAGGSPMAAADPSRLHARALDW